MPLYQYQCNNCQEEFEYLVKFSDLEPTDCPRCESKNSLKKMISSSTSFRLKGRDWYRRTTQLD